MNSSFWENKQVLITGCEGFLGSHITNRMISYGAKVIGLDIRTHRKNTFFSDIDYKNISLIKGSIDNYSLLKDIIIKHDIEIVFHLAAEAIVGKCLEDPLRAFSSNIKGTWVVLEACRNSNTVQAIVCASSDKAYGSHKKLPYKEDASLCGKHPYDVSKSCTDLLAQTYFYTYDLPVGITRCGNIYGPGDNNFSRLIPDAMRSIFQKKTFIIRSDGKFIRDYIYVEDIVDGYVLFAEKMKKLKLFGEAFNFSNECPISVLELLKLIYKLSGKKMDYKISNQARYEIKKQYLSAIKARKILGWKPKYDLVAGLKETISWYKVFFDNDRRRAI